MPLATDRPTIQRVQKILNLYGHRLPLSGILDRPTIIAAAIFAKSWHRGPSLIPIVIRRHAMNTISQIQTILGVSPDGLWGSQSQAALDALLHPAPLATVHYVTASSFADPADIAAFRRCKSQGGTDQQCFKVGDNGIGKWGDDTTLAVPMCALPPEDWRPLLDRARGARVIVTVAGRTTTCELRDTMPARANITNGAGIDLNPAALAALGLRPPCMVQATWQWA